MKSVLCTIGFTGKTAEEFFALLAQAGVHRVIDIRENRIGQLSGFAKYPDIEYFLHSLIAAEYAHEPLLAPSPEIRDAYRTSKDWPTYEATFLKLMQQRGVPKVINPAKYKGTVALLCSEPEPEKCHRRIVADILYKHWKRQGHDVEVRHLVSERKRTPKRTKVPKQ